VFGILYIAWLAWGFFKSKKGLDLKYIKCLRIQDGLLLTFLNPKAWIMQIMMFSQFFTVEESSIRIIELTLLLSLLNLSGHAVWILFGDLVLGRATSLLTPHRQNLLFGTMLLLSIGLML
jgi:threonine/homoserine/homoserine lactone efflux protein